MKKREKIIENNKQKSYMHEEIMSQEELYIAKYEEQFKNEKAQEEINENKLREFAKLLEENHWGWMDTEILGKLSVNGEYPQPVSCAECNAAENSKKRSFCTCFFRVEAIPACNFTDAFIWGQKESHFDILEEARQEIIKKKLGEILFYTIADDFIEGFVKVVLREETCSKTQIEKIIQDMLDQVPRKDENWVSCHQDIKWEVNVWPVLDFKDVVVTLSNKYEFLLEHI